jgi:hypothetical protein
MAVKMAVVKNLVAVKGLQVAVNFGEGGSEGLLRSGNPGSTAAEGRRWKTAAEGGTAVYITLTETVRYFRCRQRIQ